MATQNLGFSQYQPTGVNGQGSNPYLNQTVNGALDSVTRNYQNVVAPQMASQFAQSKSFGNSGLMAQQGIQQRGLADSLGNTAANMYGSAYATDRANDLNYSNNQANNATQRYGYDQGLIGQKYSSDNSLKGSMYGADRGLEGQKYSADASSSASMYGSDAASKASMYNSDNSRAASKYGADSSLFGNLYGVDAGVYNNAANNATTMRGQDVQSAMNAANNATAQRGQDSNYGIAQMGNDTTRMGQGMTYDLGLRNNDLGFGQLDANIANQNFANQMTAANFGLTVDNTAYNRNLDAIKAGTQIQNTPQQQVTDNTNVTNSIGNGYSTGTQTGANSTAANVLGGAIAGNTVANNLGIGNSSVNMDDFNVGQGPEYAGYTDPVTGQWTPYRAGM